MIIGAMDRATFLDLIAPQLKELEDTMKVCYCHKYLKIIHRRFLIHY